MNSLADGRAPTGQALAVPAEPASGLDPTGFDPSRDRLTILREAQARAGTVILGLVPEGHRCGPIGVNADQWGELTDAHAAEDAALAALIPTEQDAIQVMHDAYTRLKALGWNDAIYCPKDGSTFDAIQAGSTGIFKTHYSGEWPDGYWFCEDGGDLYPARPVLYRVTQAELAQREEMRARFRALRDSDGSPKGGDGEAGSVHDSAVIAQPDPNSPAL